MRFTPATASLAASILVASLPATAPAQTVNDPNLVVETVITSGPTLNFPTTMAFLSAGEILVGEKTTGRVRRVMNGSVHPDVVLDLAVNYATERGLLGMTLDPLFAVNRQVYICYTRSSTGLDTNSFDDVLDQRVSRFTWDGANLTDELPIFSMPTTPGPNHNGGVLAFGPPNVPPADQKLFIMSGDLNADNQNENYANGAPPDDTGCIIRINRDGSIPSGEDKGPFFDVPGANDSLKRMYAYGIRNSFGMAFDTHPTSGGALWDTENGDRDWDEVNRVDPAFNSGWEDQMGPTGFPEVDEPAEGRVTFGGVGTYSDPEFAWRQIFAPTSILFHNGRGLGEAYQYDCFVGTFRGSKIYRFKPNADRTGFELPGGLADKAYDTTEGDTDAAIAFGSGFFAPVDFKTGPDGNFYVLAYGNGQIYRIRNPSLPVSGYNPFQFVNIKSAREGEGFQELFFNYTTSELRVTPYLEGSQRVPYILPKGQWIGIFHYDYSASRFSQALYQFDSGL